MAAISNTQNNNSLYEAMTPYVKTINRVFHNEKDYQQYSDLYLGAVRHQNAAAASTPASAPKKIRLPLTPLNYFNATIAKK